MVQPKHMENKGKQAYKKVILFSIIFIVFFLLVFYKNRESIRHINTDINIEEDVILENEEKLIIDEFSVENEKLVLKSNYEEKKEKK